MPIILMLLEDACNNCPSPEIKKEILDYVFKNIDNLDFIIDPNKKESLLDSLLSNLREKSLTTQVLERTNDPLFSYLKPEANLFDLSTDKVNIAISHADSMWSTGIWQFARQVMCAHPNIEFRLVENDKIEKGGEEFVKQFDAWINPGGGDSYPEHGKEFDSSEWKKDQGTEIIYQNVLGLAEQFAIPVFGMCAGAQNLVLHNDGYLQSVKGYQGGLHYMHFQPTTRAYFLTLSEDEQDNAMQPHDATVVKYRGDTAHRFAGVAGKLGENIELGATSEQGVPMAYCSLVEAKCATQFHPEHEYYNPNSYGHHWLESFLKIASIKHLHKKEVCPSPTEVLEYLHSRSSDCGDGSCTIFSDYKAQLVENCWFEYYTSVVD
jgi:gamma-glutamyl-gamma-aminobutyrate hydrolase PuuD